MTAHSMPLNNKPSYQSVLELVLHSAVTVPQKMGVMDGNSSLSYSQLLACAHQNAKRLENLGVEPGDIVLCAIDRGIALPMAWLTTMIVNAVFIPVDLTWPEERIRYIAGLTKARFVLTRTEFSNLISFGLIEFDIQICSNSPPVDLSNIKVPHPKSNMYGFFTSGSTGYPKCALNHHAGVANRMSYMTKRFGMGHIVYQNSSHLFDSSIWQLLWPLTSQGTAIVPPERRPSDIDYTIQQIKRFGVTMTDLVPSIFRLLVRSLKSGKINASILSSLGNPPTKPQCFKVEFIEKEI